MPSPARLSRIIRVLVYLAVLGVFSSLLTASARAQTGNPNAPTSSQSPKEIDRAWQQAVSQYDAPRSQILKRVDEINAKGTFRADWESLQSFEVPEWYKDAKFGIFIHWGVYSVPAFGSEWYPRQMYVKGSPEYEHHLKTYGPQDKFGYKDFIPLFKAEKFDPVAWARLFRDAGAKYVIPVFEHHDGFSMYDCTISDWTAVKMGPHRDLAGDLAKAVRAEGLHLGASSHRIEHNFFFDHGRMIESDVNDPQYAGLYGPAHHWMEAHNGTPLSNDFTYVSEAWTHDWLARSAELVEKYKPEIMYFDWWNGQPSVRADLARFAAFYYNTMQSNGKVAGVINYKDFAMQEHSGVLDVERGQLAGIRPLYWQTDTSVSNRSWGYIENDSFKTTENIVHQLVDIVSKNGNLLLNVGPRSDGTIPGEVQQVLREVGAWLKQNGEAIYGTRAWRTFGEGPTKVSAGAFHDTETEPYRPEDIRFTTKNGVLYAIELAWPANRELLIHSIGTRAAGEQAVASVQMLATGANLTFRESPEGLHIQLPESAPSKFAHVYRIQFK
jgi:alpha-L-fucosidase